MMEVTIHLLPDQTDRQLERDLLALNPEALTFPVGGRNGRRGVRVDAYTALRYLDAMLTLRAMGALNERGTTVRLSGDGLIGLPPEDGQTLGVAISPSPTEPTGEVAPEPAPVAEKKTPAKKAAKKAAPAADKEVTP